MTPQVKRETLEQRISYIEHWSKWVFGASSISMAGILAFAFWLGTISTKVSNAELTISKVYGAVSEDPSSVLVRTSLVEHRLGNIEGRVTSMEAKMETRFTSLEDKVSSLEAKVNSLDTKVNSLEVKVNSLDAKLTAMDAKLNTLINRLVPERGSLTVKPMPSPSP